MAGNRCDTCHGTGEVAIDGRNPTGTCLDCDGTGRVPFDTLLGVPDFEDMEYQAEQGQGPPA